MDSIPWVWSVLVATLVATLWFLVVLQKTIRELYKLFRKDMERWWYFREAVRAVGKSEFLATQALRYISVRTGLRIQPLHVKGIKEAEVNGKRTSDVYVTLIKLKDSNNKQQRRKSRKMKQVGRLFVRQRVCVQTGLI